MFCSAFRLLFFVFLSFLILILILIFLLLLLDLLGQCINENRSCLETERRLIRRSKYETSEKVYKDKRFQKAMVCIHAKQTNKTCTLILSHLDTRLKSIPELIRPEIAKQPENCSQTNMVDLWKCDTAQNDHGDDQSDDSCLKWPNHELSNLHSNFYSRFFKLHHLTSSKSKIID